MSPKDDVPTVVEFFHCPHEYYFTTHTRITAGCVWEGHLQSLDGNGLRPVGILHTVPSCLMNSAASLCLSCHSDFTLVLL